MIELKTLEKIRKTEHTNKTGLSQLPDGFYASCQEAMDTAFRKNDYQLFVDIQRIIRNIHETRQGKLLNFAMYRSARGVGMRNPVENILPHEEKLLQAFLSSLQADNEQVDLLLNGYYFQHVRTK